VSKIHPWHEFWLTNLLQMLPVAVCHHQVQELLELIPVCNLATSFFLTKHVYLSDTPSLTYPSLSSIHSNATEMFGQFENPLDLGNVTAFYTAQVLGDQYANRSTNPTEFTTLLMRLGVSLAPLSVIHTLGTFRREFPILGNMVLELVFALTISMVYSAPDFKWIKDQQQGVEHESCHHIFTAVDIALKAHLKDYPNTPIEQGKLFCI
jgi:hypothetical protein